MTNPESEWRSHLTYTFAGVTHSFAHTGHEVILTEADLQPLTTDQYLGTQPKDSNPVVLPIDSLVGLTLPAFEGGFYFHESYLYDPVLLRSLRKLHNKRKKQARARTGRR